MLGANLGSAWYLGDDRPGVAFGAARPVLDAAESAAVPRTSGRLEG